jgi:hypothetical protein
VSSKAVKFNGQLTGFSSRSDGSVGFRGVTPELKSEEKVALFDLQNLNLDIMLMPQDDKVSEIVEVKADLGFKTPSQRLRSAIFVLYRQKTERKVFAGEFKDFYERQMDKITEWVKKQLDE